MQLALSTWHEVEDYLRTSRGIIVPIGSTEQHGPNGLIGTDHLDVAALNERLERPAAGPVPAHSPSPGYQIAIRLARGGASREELMAGCGLTLAEAELVRRLHGPHAAELRQVS